VQSTGYEKTTQKKVHPPWAMTAICKLQDRSLRQTRAKSEKLTVPFKQSVAVPAHHPHHDNQPLFPLQSPQMMLTWDLGLQKQQSKIVFPKNDIMCSPLSNVELLNEQDILTICEADPFVRGCDQSSCHGQGLTVQ
jgi:hypothetical protein